MSIALVVPTIRENCFRDFCERWGKMDLFKVVHLIVMEDNPQKTFDAEKVIEKFTHFKATHLCWEDIEADLGEKSWIIPRRSDTVRSYAYYYAWKHGYDYVLTLDDDCYPPTEADGLVYDNGITFVDRHMRALTEGSRWFNTLNSVKPRGIPFYSVGKGERTIVNHGLWTNVLDYDAPYQLANPIPEKFSFDSRVVPAGQYFPMCGMNVMWKREASVLMYHLLMGQQIAITVAGMDPELMKLPFDRFGDIWCGVFMKKIADHCGFNVTTGMPYIRHERASNPFTNLKKEANGIEVNEKLWEYVDRLEFDCQLTRGSFVFPVFYARLGQHISQYDEYKEHKEYFERLGSAMITWAELFR